MPFLTLSPLVSGSFSQSAPGEVAVYTYGPLVSVVAVYVLIIAGLSIKNMFSAFKSVEPVVRRQAYTVFAGLISSIILGAFFITVLPAVTGSERFLFLGYAAPLLFTASVFYSIFRQQLLNFRAIVARSAAYIILVALFAAIYAILVFGISNQLLGTPDFNLIQQTFYILAALFLAFSYQPIKKFIDKFTNKLFYRDAYDAQSLLNDLNSELVSSIEVKNILKNTSLLLEHYLKPSEVTFIVYESANTPESMFSTNTSPGDHAKDILAATKEVKDKIFGIEDSAETNDILKKHKVDSDIGMVAQLISTGEKGSLVGSLILGPKKSGKPLRPTRPKSSWKSSLTS